MTKKSRASILRLLFVACTVSCAHTAVSAPSPVHPPARRWAAESAPLSAKTATASDSAAAYLARIEGPQSPNRQGFDPFTIPELMRFFDVPGVSVAVIKDFAIHWAKGYGVADVGTSAPVNEHTLFQAASISKAVTAMAVLRAVQDGRSSLDADINLLLKSWKVPDSEYTRTTKVTLRSLLSHTSGADDGFGFPGYHPAAPRPTLVQILDGKPPSNVGPVSFARPPFTHYKYSGGGTVIVQLALTEALGRAFPDIMQEMVLGPIGMRDSAFEQPLSPERDRNAARAHDGGGRAMDAKWHVYPETGAAGLWTTPSDLARFAIDIQRALGGEAGHVLSRATAREMVSPSGVGPLGLGLFIEQQGDGWYFMHNGGNWGFACDVIAHFRKGYGVAIMTNSGRGSGVSDEIQARVAAAYGWDSLDKPIPR
jgi:CubicO group peptidase (beta-lactamase class C family)